MEHRTMAEIWVSGTEGEVEVQVRNYGPFYNVEVTTPDGRFGIHLPEDRPEIAEAIALGLLRMTQEGLDYTEVV